MVGRPPPDIELGGAAARPARATVFSLGTIRRCPELGLGFMAGLAERLLPESGGGAVGRMFFGMLTGGNTTGVAEPLLGMQNKANHFPSKTAQPRTSASAFSAFSAGWYSQALLKINPVRICNISDVVARSRLAGVVGGKGVCAADAANRW